MSNVKCMQTCLAEMNQQIIHMAWYVARSHTRCIGVPTGLDGDKRMDRVGQPQKGSVTWSVLYPAVVVVVVVISMKLYFPIVELYLYRLSQNSNPPIPRQKKKIQNCTTSRQQQSDSSCRTEHEVSQREILEKKAPNRKRENLKRGEVTMVTHDHYTILNLQFTESSSSFSKQQLKLAYHQALLKHHPDKTQDQDNDKTPRHGHPSPTNVYTIDEITTAYKTLSDPLQRAEYDRSLRLDRLKTVEREKTGAVFHTGLEVVDLEDLQEEEEEGSDGLFWFRGCRCGDERGFMVTEEDLEREEEHGEVVVGCRGCSLYMKVLFAVGGDDEPEAEQKT